MNDSAEFSVRFEGSKPWSLVYEVVKGKLRLSYRLEDVNENLVTVKTDPLKESGTYVISLMGNYFLLFLFIRGRRLTCH
jgi:hypothetical protein